MSRLSRVGLAAILLVGVSLCARSVHAQALQPFPLISTSSALPDLPVQVSPLARRPLAQCTDSTLQARLDHALMRPRWSPLIAHGRMAVGIVDLSDPGRPRYAAVNGDSMMYAASLPKIGILYAATRQLHDGRLTASPALERDLHAMIRVSSNAAATRTIDRVGGLQAVNQTLTDAAVAFYDPQRDGGLWVGKRFASDGRRQPDPINGLSHAATVHQVARFYTLLATGRLISRARSAQMLDVLANPGIDHKFVHALRRRAPNVAVYRKSGSWRHWHADSALVWGPRRRYVVVALVADARGEQILRALVPAVERALGVSTVGTGS